jgi:Histidine-specific methyltransferase, SAM-dependent
MIAQEELQEIALNIALSRGLWDLPIVDPEKGKAALLEYADIVRTGRRITRRRSDIEKEFHAALYAQNLTSEQIREQKEQWNLSRSNTYERLAEETTDYSLARGYGVPPLLLGRVDIATRRVIPSDDFESENQIIFAALQQNYKNAYLTLTQDNFAALPSGMERFRLITEWKPYWPAVADPAIWKEKGKKASLLWKDAHVVDIGCAGGDKLVMQYLQAVADGCMPKRISYIDNVGSAVDETTRKLREAGFKGEVDAIVGDFLNPEFATDYLWKEMRESPDPGLILYSGNTINNFPHDVIRRQLRAFKDICKKGTNILIAADASRGEAVDLGYLGNTAMLQFPLVGYIYDFRVIGVRLGSYPGCLDPTQLDCRGHVINHSRYDEIQLIIKNRKDQILYIPGPDNTKYAKDPGVLRVLPEGDETVCRQGHKDDRKKWRELFKSAGLKVVARWPFKDVEKKFKNDRNEKIKLRQDYYHLQVQ